ncbi:MAG: hypothetical protein GY851_27215 [bacterium]|nr:hypothetical protein [bacterium]
MRYADISGWVEPDMWAYSSAYPQVRIQDCPHPPEFPPEYPVFCQHFHLTGQSGTYIETRAHVDSAAPKVVDCPISDFIMDATILRVPATQPNTPIERGDLEALGLEIAPDSAVIVATGWDQHWREPDFLEGSPYLTRDAALWLIEQDIRCLAGDFPRFDYVPKPCFPWAEFWDRVPYLLAPVCSVFEEEFTRGRLFAFPMKIQGAMGTPVRAVLEIDAA